MRPDDRLTLEGPALFIAWVFIVFLMLGSVGAFASGRISAGAGLLMLTAFAALATVRAMPKPESE